jgi:hypothetical protein
MIDLEQKNLGSVSYVAMMQENKTFNLNCVHIFDIS